MQPSPDGMQGAPVSAWDLLSVACATRSLRLGPVSGDSRRCPVVRPGDQALSCSAIQSSARRRVRKRGSVEPPRHSHTTCPVSVSHWKRQKPATRAESRSSCPSVSASPGGLASAVTAVEIPDPAQSKTPDRRNRSAIHEIAAGARGHGHRSSAPRCQPHASSPMCSARRSWRSKPSREAASRISSSLIEQECRVPRLAEPRQGTKGAWTRLRPYDRPPRSVSLAHGIRRL
jgi:hypothetical protein